MMVLAAMHPLRGPTVLRLQPSQTRPLGPLAVAPGQLQRAPLCTGGGCAFHARWSGASSLTSMAGQGWRETLLRASPAG